MLLLKFSSHPEAALFHTELCGSPFSSLSVCLDNLSFYWFPSLKSANVHLLIKSLSLNQKSLNYSLLMVLMVPNVGSVLVCSFLVTTLQLILFRETWLWARSSDHSLWSHLSLFMFGPMETRKSLSYLSVPSNPLCVCTWSPMYLPLPGGPKQLSCLPNWRTFMALFNLWIYWMFSL